MKRIIILVGLIGFLAVSSSEAGEKIVFSEDFSKAKDGDSVSALGWKVDAKADQSLWEIENGILKVTHFHKPYKGGSIEHEIPFIKKGMLDFDVKIGSADNTNFSLQIHIYGIGTSFKGYDGNLWWNRYEYDESNKNDIGWAGISKLNLDQQYHCRVLFDADTNVVEYYVDNMDDPVFRDTQDKVEGYPDVNNRAPDRILLGNYGLCPGTVINYVDNIKLISIEKNIPEK